MILGAFFLPILDLFALPAWELTSLFSFEASATNVFPFQI